MALGLAAIADSGPLTEFQRAQVDVLRAQIAFAVNRGRDAPPLLLKAAKRLESLDARLARETYLDALTAAVLAHRLATGTGLLQVADAVRTAPSVLPPRASDLLLDGWVLLITEGYQAGTPMLKRALSVVSQQVRPQGRGDPLALARLSHGLRALGRRNVASVFRAPGRARPRSRSSR